MNNNLQLVLKSSTTEMSLNDHSAGIYLTPELDGLTGLPEIRTTSGVNAGYDGGWTSAQKFDARSIVIRGTIANNDKTEVERMRRELVALLAQGKNEQLELDFVTETGRAYEVQVRTIACDMALQKVLTQQDFMITLRADDPLIYDNSSAGEEATVNISGATGGFRIPFEIPLAIDAGSEETVVENTGLESVAPTVKMYGALHNPKIINHTTNQSMQIQAELGFAEGAWINPVDAPEGTNVTFNPTMDAPIESVKLKGNTEQTTYTGKNQFDISQYTNAIIRGGGSAVSVTKTNDTTLKLTNLISQANNFVMIPLPTATRLLNGTATISFDAKLTNVTNAKVTFYWLSNSNYTDQLGDFVQVNSNGSYSVTATVPASIPSGSTRLAVALYSAGSAQPVNSIVEFSNIQVEAGTATTYEPYVGGGPAPSPAYPQPIQVVTGEQTIKIHGKNLCRGVNQNYWLNTAANSAGQTAGNSGVGISVSANTYYTISTQVTQARYRVAFVDSLPTSNTGITAYSGQTKDGTSDSITINSGAHGYLIVNATSLADIQIEVGSSATSFEPYQEQSYEVDLNCNIYDKSQAYMDGNDMRVPISITPGSTYAFEAPTRWVGAYLYDSSDNLTRTIGHTSSTLSGEFTADSNEVKAIFTFYVGTSTTWSWSDVEFYDVAGVIELYKIGDYQDYIYKSEDKWYVHKEINRGAKDVDVAAIASDNTASPTNVSAEGTFQIGNWAWSYYADTIARARMSSNIGVYKLDTSLAGNTQARAMTSGTFCQRYGTNDRVYFRNTAYIGKTGNEVRAMLLSSGGGADFAWVMATPTDTEITNAALIEQLEALVDGTAKVYATATYISTLSATDLPNIFAARYYSGKDPDQRDELIIDSRLRTITLNGLDVYHLKTDGSEFIMLAPGENKLSLQSDIVGDNGYAKVSYKQGYLSI